VPDSVPIEVLLPLAVGGVAFLYSSVGHGGATGYLALAALVGLSPALARPGALWLNCVVAGIAFWRFKAAGFFEWRIFVPLAAASVPSAFLGSQFHLEGRAYAVLLGVALLVAGWLLGWGRAQPEPEKPRDIHWPAALSSGALLGFLAGLTGIGGGVFLTPWLIFLGWTSAKKAGGVSALFIVVNSIAGLIGLGPKALIWETAFVASLVAGIAGAGLGTWCGVQRWGTLQFRRALSIVLWIAAAKLILTGR
jgi:uncharacterized membrane protein YfcA